MKFFALIGVIGMSCVSSAVALGQVTATAAPANAVPATAAATPAPAVQDPAVTANYIIGPGDTLQIFVWRNPELTATVPVRPDGKISTPLVEDMVAVGKTPSQLARDIEKVLSEYVRSPQVNVIVSEPVSTFSQVKVIGQVATPQSLAYREGMRVLDVDSRHRRARAVCRRQSRQDRAQGRWQRGHAESEAREPGQQG